LTRGFQSPIKVEILGKFRNLFDTPISDNEINALIVTFYGHRETAFSGERIFS
jgi:hypothetical protein